MLKNKPSNKSLIMTCHAVITGDCPHPDTCRFAYGIWDRHLSGSVLCDPELMSMYRDCACRGHWTEKCSVIDVKVLEQVKRHMEIIRSMRTEWVMARDDNEDDEDDDVDDSDEYPEDEYIEMPEEYSTTSNRIYFTGAGFTANDTSSTSS